MNIRDIRNIDDVKKYLKIVWGAITTFQNSISSIVGNLEEITSILVDVRAEMSDLSELTTEIKKLNMNEPNNVDGLVMEYQKYREETGKNEKPI